MELLTVGVKASWSFSLGVVILNFLLCMGLPTIGNDTDRLALLALKNGITQDPFKVMSSWNDSLHMCEWPGVTCNSRRLKVTILDLHSQKLMGIITPSIGNLTFLRRINLAENGFTGEIPEALGRLFRLQHLNLSKNSLGIEIPSNLSRCSNLVAMDLSYNNLQGKIPGGLGSLRKLVTMNLSDNHLTQMIPPSFGNLSSLVTLNLVSNGLKGGIPDDLGRLTNLEEFQVSGNELSGGIPPQMYNLSSLISFNVAINQLNGRLPQDMGISLPKLQGILLGGNGFTGPIPSSLSNASELADIGFSNNMFTGSFPTGLGSLRHLKYLTFFNNMLESHDLSFLNSLNNCSSLEVLGLYNNSFRGVFMPNSIANLSTQLSILTMGENEIEGSIPAELMNLVNLRLLSLKDNFLRGSIPDTLGILQNLQLLSLRGNNLSATLPPSLGNLTRMFSLTLERNNLEGSIPWSLNNLPHLEYLDLSRNYLSGTIIPQHSLGFTSPLLYLNLSYNSFTGTIPLAIGQLVNIVNLDISHNNLSGEIPPTLQSFLSLTVLYLQGNHFEGGIPSFFGALTSITDMNLSHNKLSGKIPDRLGKLPLIEELDLSYNDLEGEIPMEGIFKTASAISVMGNSRLCGGISELHLSTCITKGPKGSKKKLINFLVCGFLGSVLIIFSVLLLLRWSKKRKIVSGSPSRDSFLRVSYDRLLKATDGFSSSNLIGTGSFGSVYKGVLDEHVAVKVLNLQNRRASGSFVAECNALRNIRHRNLVKILTVCSGVDFQGNDFKALIYEFMTHGTLDEWLHPNPDAAQDEPRCLDLQQRLSIAIDVASALEYLHHCCQIPIVHCDLKPSNVLLDNDLVAHVSDFGLARFIQEANTDFPEISQNNSVGVKGSMGYAAPEYGTGSEASRYGDVYSYGILLLEMFTGKRPTDAMFKDDLNLHNFVKIALPERAMEIVDPVLLYRREEPTSSATSISIRVGTSPRSSNELQEHLISLLRIGVACSAELPRERMSISDVVNELQSIRNIIGETRRTRVNRHNTV